VLGGADGLWLVARRPGGTGLALRIAHLPGGARGLRRLKPRKNEVARFKVRSVLGVQDVSVCANDTLLPTLRVTNRLTPADPLLIPYLPRDLYPLGPGDDPMTACGEVEAAQRGLNSGICLLRHRGFGTTLYFQNFTALNDYFAQTGTKPDGAVGGLWPELGYLPPTPRQSPQPPTRPLAAGKPVVLLDTILAFHDDESNDEQGLAERFLDLSAAVYALLDRPPTEFHDWPARARRTLDDLQHSPKATVRHYGHVYVHPYTDAEYPDCMVQMTLAASLGDFERWGGQPVPLKDELLAGMGKFYDPRLRTLRRYLPNVGKDKNRFAVDSWYLYHPMLNLGRLAQGGDARCRRLLLKSIDYGIKAAHHFDYHFPIQYDVRDFSVIVEARSDGLGQTDVAGIYAYVMLLAFELTDDVRFLEEARRAIASAKGMRFSLNYQANLTAWGAAACLWLWRIDDDESYLRQSYVYLASFFHNAAMWESDIEWARCYSNFLGVTPLHDATYMALYECFDTFAAFGDYLARGGPALSGAVRTLVSEYCRYVLHRAHFYYPDALPKEALSPTQREKNGHIDRALSFPLEDLYIDGQQAGQVGQEVYGAGAAFVFASRSTHLIDGAPFKLFCDHFLSRSSRPTAHRVVFGIAGGAGDPATLSLLPLGRKRLPRVRVMTADGTQIEPFARHRDRIDYRVPLNIEFSIDWNLPTKESR
jgi:hypothetical protein